LKLSDSRWPLFRTAKVQAIPPAVEEKAFALVGMDKK
jgi:hypothetical protein